MPFVEGTIDNDVIDREAKAFPDRLIPFCSVNPWDRGAAIETIRHCVEDQGMQGIKLHPTLHGYRLGDHGLVDPIFSAARDLGVVVTSHGASDLYNTPHEFARWREAFPDVPLWMVHMGFFWMTDFAIEVAQRAPQSLPRHVSRARLRGRPGRPRTRALRRSCGERIRRTSTTSGSSGRCHESPIRRRPTNSWWAAMSPASSASPTDTRPAREREYMNAHRTIGRLAGRSARSATACSGHGQLGWLGRREVTRVHCSLPWTWAVDFFDTAWGYGEGRSEHLLGELVRANPDKRITTATKIPPKNFQWPTRRGDLIENAYPPDHIREFTEKSLTNLGLPGVDLILFHVWEDAWADDEGWQRAVDDLRREGLVRAVGISLNRWEPWNSLKTIRTGLIDAVQVIYNIFDQAPEDELFPLARELGVGVIARVPFDEGHADRHADAGLDLAGGRLAQHLLRA